jgi:hypothetical protein
MSKCEFIYEADPVGVRLTGGMGGFTTPRCKTHDCTMMLRVVSGEVTACLVGGASSPARTAAEQPSDR